MAVLSDSFKLIIVLLSVFVCVNSWLSCDQTFCKYIRRPETPKGKNDTLNYNTVIYHDSTIEAEIKTESSPLPLRFQLSVSGKSTFRLLIDERNINRHRVPEALDGQFPPLPITYKKDDAKKIITVNYEDDAAVIHSEPFKVKFYNNGRLVSVVNAENRLVFQTATTDKVAIALDVSFKDVQRAYGIPEHAERLALRSTTVGLDPYRHFNLDYGSYQIISTESLYGAIPILYAHGIKYSSAALWLNSAQTWIDTTIGPNTVDAFFMSESGAMEMFIFTGPTIKDAVQQYAKLTGVAPLPPLFSLGYHQSRYSYMTQTEVEDVVKNFDASDFPVDVMWLDIDYTQDKKYFTWDGQRFPQPLQLLDNLASTQRKLVAIIDPHFKVDDNYFLHTKATAEGYYVKQFENNILKDYVGLCWPGESSYLDFFNPDAFNYYASLYSEKPEFNHTNIHLWNDMNEPAVFQNPAHEQTMSGDLIHFGNLKHRDVHNIYGFFQTMGTRKGLLARAHNVRPFILTRSHFVGIQRYAAIWTGDNRATWEYLQISIPMCLTEALAGVSFCGADVAGFAGIPDDELFQRWYQAGAWLPFYRGHSAIDVPRREPYLYVQEIQDRVKVALHQRYAHLPVWYTLFREHEQTYEPVIRPITYHYPNELAALSLDNEFLVGANILAAPVLQQGVFSTHVYLPGGESEIWYHIDDNFAKLNGSGYHLLNVTLNSVPVFYRGGSIIPRKNIPRRTTVGTHNDPYTLYICPNNANEAEGTLYVDDYESFKYQTDKEYLYIQLVYANNAIYSSMKINEDNYYGAARLNQVVLINPPANVIGVTFAGDRLDNLPINATYSDDKKLLFINDISVNLQREFGIYLTIEGSNSVVFKLSSFLLFAAALRFILI